MTTLTEPPGPRGPGLVRRVSDAIDQAPLWALGVVGLLVSLFVFGAHSTPNYDWFGNHAALDPFHPPADLGDYGPAYLLSSPLGPVLSWLLHLRTATGYLLLHSTLVVGALLGMPYLVRRWRSDLAARVTLVSLWCSPLASVLLGWIGQPDPFTLTGATLVAIGPGPWPVAGAVLLGVNHFEQGIFIVIGACVIRRLRGETVQSLLAIPLALGIGKGLLTVYEQAFDMVAADHDRLASVLTLGKRKFAASFLSNLPTLLFSIYNVVWVGVVLLWKDMPKPTKWRLAFMQLLCLIPVVITLDSTRVAALITWPILLFVAEWASTTLPRERLCGYLALMAIAGAVVPRVIVWEGSVTVSNLYPVFQGLLH